MNFGIASLSDRAGALDDDRRSHRASPFAAALEACKYLFRHFWPLLRLALLPIIAAGLVLYIALSRYLAALLLFLEAPNPRVASLALGTLAAGLFLSLFCYSIAVSAICDLVLGKPPRGTWFRFKVERQEWRFYAAYLRLLLLLSVILVLAFLISTYVAPLLLLPVAFISWFLTVASVIGVTWLFARIGFLIAPVVATTQGPVLRRARQESARDLWRNSLLMALLLIPGALVLIVGGYAFQMGASPLGGAGTFLLADSARSMKELLGAFVTLISLSVFVTIVLLTVGAIAAYEIKHFRTARDVKPQPINFGTKVGHSVPAEGPPK